MPHRLQELDHILALSLLKLRMLTNLKAIDNSRVIGEKVPLELFNSIQDNLISAAVASNEIVLKNTKDGNSLSHHIDTIESQINEVFDRADNANEHLWPALIEPGHHLSARPQAYSLGTVEEMQLTLRYNYRSWIETPGAINFVKAKLQD